MTIFYTVGIVLAVLLGVYLIFALLLAEDF